MIIGSAILDDVLGLIVLAVVAGSVTETSHSSGGSGLILWIVLKAAGFLGITVLLGHFLSPKIVMLVRQEHGTFLIVGIALCFLFAYIAKIIGLADIIGAFAAGVFLDPYGIGIRTKTPQITLRELLTPLSDVFVPLFFVVMGLQVSLVGLADFSVLALGAVLIVAAVIGKLFCGLGVIGDGINRLAVGIGMIPRGEVAAHFCWYRDAARDRRPGDPYPECLFGYSCHGADNNLRHPARSALGFCKAIAFSKRLMTIGSGFN